MLEAKNSRGEIVRAAQAGRSGTYTCLRCGAPVVPKSIHPYAKNTPHFAHAKYVASAESCDLYIEAVDSPRPTSSGSLTATTLKFKVTPTGDDQRVRASAPRFHLAIEDELRLTFTFFLPSVLHRFSGSLEIDQCFGDNLGSVYEITARNAFGEHRVSISPSFSPRGIRLRGSVDSSYADLITEAATDFSNSESFMFPIGGDGGFALPSRAPLILGESYILMSRKVLPLDHVSPLSKATHSWEGCLFYVLHLDAMLDATSIRQLEEITGRNIRTPKPTLSLMYPYPIRHDRLGITWVSSDNEELVFSSNRPNELEVLTADGASIEQQCQASSSTLTTNFFGLNEVVVAYRGAVLFHVRRISSNFDWESSQFSLNIDGQMCAAEKLPLIVQPGSCVHHNGGQPSWCNPVIRRFGIQQIGLSNSNHEIRWGDDLAFGPLYRTTINSIAENAQSELGFKRKGMQTVFEDPLRQLKEPLLFNGLRTRDLRMRIR